MARAPTYAAAVRFNVSFAPVAFLRARVDRDFEKAKHASASEHPSPHD
jgi:hypothetical protein